MKDMNQMMTVQHVLPLLFLHQLKIVSVKMLKELNVTLVSEDMLLLQTENHAMHVQKNTVLHVQVMEKIVQFVTTMLMTYKPVILATVLLTLLQERSLIKQHIITVMENVRKWDQDQLALWLQ